MGKVIALNHNWRYKAEWKEEFIAPSFDDSSWEAVHVPHANLELPYNYFDEKSYQFISTYRQRFKLDQSHQGKRILVNFEAVMAYAEVYLNGKLVGSHKGGYTPFSIDLTEHILFDKENVLTVQVDSRERDDIPPFGHMIDYLCYGGIYREVSLSILDPLYIKNVFAKPQNVLAETKQVETTVFLKNTDSKEQTITIEVNLSKDGQDMPKAQKEVTIAPNTEESFDIYLKDLEGIKLWDIDSPNLYDLKVKLSRDKEQTDSFHTRIGFREAVVKPDGFYLNGEKI
ncbi:MAG: glycoside hydrolase family 2 protein, partial [Firmicutes bacterium]|nr:glycoside hydrolase family 2 protein [Bacillota bacterium]